MNGKYNIDKVKAWLSGFRDNERDVDDQFERLERLKARLESCSAPEITDMPRSPGFATDKMSMMLARKVDLESSLNNYVERQREYLRRIEYMVERLPKSVERTVIRLRYEDGMPWADISFTLYGDSEDYLERESTYLRKVYNLHGDALYDMAVYFSESGDPEVAFFAEFVPRYRYNRS